VTQDIAEAIGRNAALTAARAYPGYFFLGLLVLAVIGTVPYWMRRLRQRRNFD
jgi:hypothetical protein